MKISGKKRRNRKDMPNLKSWLRKQKKMAIMNQIR